MQTSDLNVNNIESDHATAIFRQFQDALFSREHTFHQNFDQNNFWSLTEARNCNPVTAKRGCHRQHFAGIFVSEPMTLPEIDHVSFLQSMSRHFSTVKIIVNTYASSMRSRVSYRFQINSSYTCGRAKTIRVDAKCFENGEKKVAFSNEYGYQWTGHWESSD